MEVTDREWLIGRKRDQGQGEKINKLLQQEERENEAIGDVKKERKLALEAI